MGGSDVRLTGTRGGRDQFNWETVKTDKDREFYLGASVQAPVGRWQANKDILWYTRDAAGAGAGPSSAAAAAAEELAAVRAEEARLMGEALGERPVQERGARAALDGAALKALLAREGGGGEDDKGARVKGVGYKRDAADGVPKEAGFALAERLPGLAAGVVGGGAGAGVGGGVARGAASPAGSGDSGERRAAKRARREAKEARRDAKDEKRERKRERKEREREEHRR